MGYLPYALCLTVLMCIPKGLQAANVAAGKFANQTGVLDGMVATRAVDGLRDDLTQGPDYYKAVCATVDTGDVNTPAQWLVDLGATYTVSGITVWNTYSNATGAASWMQYFGVHVIPTDGNVTRCGVHRSPNPVSPGGSITFLCPTGTTGKYVSIAKLSSYANQDRITLCEVEVEDQPLSSSTMAPTTLTTSQPSRPNIALHKPTNQSGTHLNDPGGTSDRAVDGLYDYFPSNQKNLTYCARIDSTLQSQPAEWWVDLQKLYVIESVKVTNTPWDGAYFRMKDFRIDIIHHGQPDTVCGENTVQVPRAGSVRLTCPYQAVGRYVRFVKTDVGPEVEDSIRRVSLCEVEVSGERFAPVANHTNQAISVNSITNTHMFVEWGQLEVLPGTTQFYGYDLVYWPSSDSLAEVTQSLVHGTTSWKLTGLAPNTSYVVELRPYRQQSGSKDYGQYYPQRNVKTKCQPDPPLSVHVHFDVQENLIKVLYELPDSTGVCNNITSARVRYRRAGLPWDTTSDTPATNNSTILVLLESSGTYEVQLVLTNDHRYRRDSAIHTIHVVVTTSVTATQTTMHEDLSETVSTACNNEDAGVATSWAVAGTAIAGLLVSCIFNVVLALKLRNKHVKNGPSTNHVYENGVVLALHSGNERHIQGPTRVPGVRDAGARPDVLGVQARSHREPRDHPGDQTQDYETIRSDRPLANHNGLALENGDDLQEPLEESPYNLTEDNSLSSPTRNGFGNPDERASRTDAVLSSMNDIAGQLTQYEVLQQQNRVMPPNLYESVARVAEDNDANSHV